MAIDDQDDPTAVNSIWWYGVAFSMVWAVLAWLLLMAYVATPSGPARPGAELVVLAVGLLVINPISLYLDMVAIEQSGAEWSPNGRRYLAAAVVGIPATLFTVLVAAAYLYRRHQHVGSP